MFRGSVKSTGYPLHSPVSPSLPLPGFTVCHHVVTGLFWWNLHYSVSESWLSHYHHGDFFPSSVVAGFTSHPSWRWFCGGKKWLIIVLLIFINLFNIINTTHVILVYNLKSLGAFAKFRKSAISFVVSVCPLETTQLPLDGFPLNLTSEYFSTICRENSSYV